MDLREGVPTASTLLLLARHAESQFNAQKRFCGRSEVPLSILGRAQAHALAERLGEGVDAVYSSRLGRAVETARAVAEPHLLDGIEELDQGELEGLSFSEAFSRYPDFFAQWKRDPESVRDPLGESLLDLRLRVEASLRGLVERAPVGQTVLVVGHQLAWASLLAHVRQVEARKWNRHALPNARFARIWRSEGAWFADAGPEPYDADGQP